MTAAQFLEKWFSPDDLRAVPELYVTEHMVDDEKRPVAKLFTPDGNLTWYVLEASAVIDRGDREVYVPLIHPKHGPQGGYAHPNCVDVLMFCLVEGYEKEFGYVSLRELAELRGLLGLPVERDMWWTPPLLSELVSW